MAVGFPAKGTGGATTWTNGNQLPASDLNDLGGTLNLITPSAKGDIFIGSAANTYTKLSVGTNNYVLTADSTQTTGVKWAAASDTTKIPLSTVTAKGDLIVATGVGAVSNLAVGTNGYVLTADSTQTTGTKWAASASGANWTLVNAGGTALTGAQTVTVSGISGADKIMVIVSDGSSASANAEITVRLNGDTASNYYNYGGGMTYTSTTFGTPLNYVGAYAYIKLGKIGGDSNGVVDGYAQITGCNASGVKVFTFASAATPVTGGQAAFVAGGGYYNSATVISSVSIFSSTGNLDNGTVYVYTSA